MAEKITPGLEKIFFKYILDNPTQFEKVESIFFNHDDISFVYEITKLDYLKSKKIPSPQQIMAMVKISDVNDNISDNVIKSILKGDNDKYEEEWILERFRSWKLANSIRSNTMKQVEMIRGLDVIDFDSVDEVAQKISSMVNDYKSINDDDTDLGSDFDDPEAHKVTEINKKISSGWGKVDILLNGGWDQASFNVIMGETSVGKSMWMQNMSVNLVDQGANVLFISLEMGVQKCMRRLGSMRLKIPIDKYDKQADDTVYMANKIKSLKSKNGGLFNSKPGMLTVKKFDTGTLTISMLDNFITKYEEYKGIKVNAVVLDYINIMGLEKGLDFSNNLFLKGKYLAEGLRGLADKHNVVMITATQTDKAIWGGNDIELKNIPESKAIAETADTFFAIIRNPQMQRDGKYRLKALKIRDGDGVNSQISFDFDKKFLIIENDDFYDA